jgi:ElaB/YqjD/DUF883 family membrane-anchored ribosome-binding protein
MPAAAFAPSEETKAQVKERVVEAARRLAHASHESRLLKTVAEDAVEDGLYAAKRAMKTVHRKLDEMRDVREEAIRRVKRQPLQAVGIALGAGIVLGAFAGWFVTRRRA